MTDDNDAVQTDGAATPAPDTSRADVKTPAKVENPGEATTPDVGDNASEGSERPKRHGYQKRIDELVRDKHETAQDRDYWREVALRGGVSANTPAPQKAVASEDAPPNVGEFSDYEEYLKALSRHEVRLENKRAENEKSEREVAQSRRKALGAFSDKVSQLSARIPDLQDAVDLAFRGGVAVSDAMAEVIVEHSERGPEVLYHLVNNPDLADQIARMKPAAAAIAIARLETQLASPEPKRVTSAPPPPSKVTGAADVGRKSLKEMSTAEYCAWYKTRGKKA
jgi:hypothetical protein